MENDEDVVVVTDLHVLTCVNVECQFTGYALGTLVDVQVFGRVARGQDTADSDIDLLVDLKPGTGLFTLMALQGQLERLLEANVDLVPADSLKDDVQQNVHNDTVSL